MGASHFPTSLPGSGKSGPGVFFVSLREGGVAPPNTPFPAAKPGGGGAQILGAGRASVASPNRPHGRLPAAPQPRAAVPTCSPDSSSPLGARAGGRVSQLTRVSETRLAPAGTKCSCPGPGSSRRPARLGPAVCKHKVSQGAGERVSELGSSTSRQPSPAPTQVPGVPRSATYLSGPAAQCGLRPVSPHGAWGSLGSQPGPAATRRDCPCALRRAAPRRSFQCRSQRASAPGGHRTL